MITWPEFDESCVSLFWIEVGMLPERSSSLSGSELESFCPARSSSSSLHNS
jgi:hypothetical protein